MKKLFVLIAALLFLPLSALAAAPAKPDPNFIATPAELKARIPKQLHITKPDFIVFVPEVTDAGVNDTGNEHFLVFDGPDGSLMAVWTQSSAEAQPDQHIAFAQSKDEGKTWSKPRIIAGPKKPGDGHMASWGYPLVSKKGRIYVLYSQHIGRVDNFPHHTGWLHGIYSDDNGATWSKPQNVPVARSINDNPDPTMPPNMLCWQKPLRLGKDGKYFAGFTRWTSFAVRKNPTKSWISADSRVEFMRFENVDDNPEPQDLKISWFMSNEKALSVPFPGHPEVSACQEPTVVKLPDGRLFCVMRTASGSPFWSVSSDTGETWTQPRRLLRKDGGKPLLHPLSPCPMYDVGGNEAGSGRYALFIHNHDGHYKSYGPTDTSFHRRPIYLVSGHFKAGAEQPVWFDEPKLFMDHDGVSLGKPGTKGRLDLALYSSFTVRNGKPVLWYPERKFFLLGRVIGKEWFEPISRRYDFYQPEVKHVVIHEGKLAEGHYAYNHMASVEWFDGRFHCVWGAHAETHLEGTPGQVNVWATSDDFERWSAPQRLAHTGPGALPADPQCVQWQPNLLNYRDRQLWCVWSFNSKNPDLDGLYLSTLEKGSLDWKHRRIQRRQEVNGQPCAIFASQNPVLLASGRVLAPVTLTRRDPKHDAGGGHKTGDTVLRWNACFYTDDGGATWHCSNPISSVDDAEAQWEPFFYEQSDGRLRALMRNFTKGIPHGTQWRLTTVGTGAAKGAPVNFPNDPVYSFMETVNCRPQIFRLDGGRYCLLQQDAFVNHRDYSTRLNIALHFSRSGADDFVAGPPLSRPGVISAYPQGVAHGGNIYLAYTFGPGDQSRGIEGAIVTPAPRADRYYVWPRSKELIKMQEEKDAAGKKKVVRANPDSRTALPRVKTVEQRKTIQFSARASAGVDIDPVDFSAGQSLEFSFETKVLRLQPVGRLVFCSMGDRIPIRLGMPANRPGKLYAYTRNQWEPVCDFPMQEWHTLRVTVRGADFSVAVDDQPPRTFPNPIVNPTPRLYLGDGFEVDYIYSLAGSEFLVDIASLRSQVGDSVR